MALTQDDVVHILRLLNESPYENLRLEMNGLKLMVSKHGSSVIFGEDRVSSEPEDPGFSLGNNRGRSSPDFPASPPEVVNERSGDTFEMVQEGAEKGLVPITAPMLGTFYRSPKADEPPFVEVGQMVDETTTVCIIEVMKLFSAIHAGSRGRIEKICAEDGELVEYGQILFWISPEEESAE